MLRVTRVLTGLLAAAAIGGCANIRIHTDYDTGADFSRLGSYAWLPGPRPPAADPRLDNSLLDARIRRAVEAHLAERGYPMTSAEGADFLVTYYVALDKKLDVRTIPSSYGYSYGYGRGRWYGGVGTETVVDEYEEGTLLLDFVDPKTRELLWRASARARIRPDTSPEESQKRIDKAVAAMLERFPPE